MRRAAGALAAGLLIAACGGSGSPRPHPVVTTATGNGPRINVTSPAFAPGAAIPRQYTCDGRDVSPPLRWSGVPANATQISIVMLDPDAPGGVFHHWGMRFPASVRSVSAGKVPRGAVEGKNDFGTLGYRGPCPPAGPAHHYVIVVTATSGRSAVAHGTLTGTYARR
jgi:Raf kinase inhibitor-like YbhB/YbcL family protein